MGVLDRCLINADPRCLHSWQLVKTKLKHFSEQANDNTHLAFSVWALGQYFIISSKNKANLRDLIAATGQVISNWIQIINFSARVTVKFDGWPRKTIGHFFYTTSSFVHHFKSIGEFKLELQSGNAQSGSNLTIFRAMRPCNLRDDLAKQ